MISQQVINLLVTDQDQSGIKSKKPRKSQDLFTPHWAFHEESRDQQEQEATSGSGQPACDGTFFRVSRENKTTIHREKSCTLW